MAIEEREIEVRALTGESTVIRLSPDKTVHDLKLLLSRSFAPASSSPKFHLFFKGTRLSLQNGLSSLAIEPGEFLVVVPFMSKNPPKVEKPEFVNSSVNVPNQGGTSSSFADSTYADMMQEFSSLSKDQVGGNGDKDKDVEVNLFADKYLQSSGRQGVDRDDLERHHIELLWSILFSHKEDVFDEQNSEKFVQVSKSLNCLSSPRSGQCIWASLTKAYSDDIWSHKENGRVCLCPEWLKKIMGTFSLLSIISAFLLLREQEVSLLSLNTMFNRVQKHGVAVGAEDLEHLAILAPKVICFATSGTKCGNAGDTIVIVQSPSDKQVESEEQLRAGKQGITISKVFRIMKKREKSFKNSLQEAIKSLLCKTKQDSTLFSLEDLIKFLKENGSLVRGNRLKRSRGCESSASSYHAATRKCYDSKQLLPEEMIDHLRRGLGSEGQIVHVENISARKACFVEIPHQLSDVSKSALRSIGIDKLYSHQAESVLASISGKNVVVATMTSSGKSLCYNLPVLEELSHNLSSCALYLFPTKALAQDQLRSLLGLTKEFDASINIGIYDGDTSQSDRTWLRDNARLLITNPDMLHLSILPSHKQFSRILANLRFLVIDEAHVYKGAFGCHTALILRRLGRLCSHVYGSDPLYVFSTATSANPREHCMELANLSTLELIENDGSPSSEKCFVLWNPCIGGKNVRDNTWNHIDANTYERSSSPIWEVSALLAEMVQHGLRSIAFCKSRKLCELVLSYTREILQETAPDLVSSICAYRGGYIAEDRRRIEVDFFSGMLCGIAATNALELGIDVGHIDVTLHLGFPGSIASLWQQAGRSGRRERPSLAVYVAFEGPLDQHFMKFPDKLFRGPIECCHIDAQNQQVLEQQLLCAALEHPLSLLYDERHFGSGLKSAVTALKNRGYISSDPSADPSSEIWNYIGHEKMPSRSITIRAIEAERYAVIDKQTDRVLEEIEESRAFFQVYDGAVYMHQGKTYLVKDLDLSRKIAICEAADLKYYTKTRDYTDIHVLGGKIAYPARISKDHHPGTTAQASTCKVSTTWFGFYRIWKGSKTIFDAIELSLPKFSYESQAVWISVPQPIKTEVEKNFSFRAGLHAACHAVLHVVPLYIRCNSSDLAPECPNPHDSRFYPERILLYDQHPGGTGVVKQIQPHFTKLLNAALELLSGCHCYGETGCPNCIQNLACGEYNELLNKDAAILIIKGVLDAEKSYFE